MQTKLLYEWDGKRTFAVVLQACDEAMRCLQDFVVGKWIGELGRSQLGPFLG